MPLQNLRMMFLLPVNAKKSLHINTMKGSVRQVLLLFKLGFPFLTIITFIAV